MHDRRGTACRAPNPTRTKAGGTPAPPIRGREAPRGFLLAGSTRSKGAGGADLWALRLDGEGRLR